MIVPLRTNHYTSFNNRAFAHSARVSYIACSIFDGIPTRCAKVMFYMNLAQSKSNRNGENFEVDALRRKWWFQMYSGEQLTSHSVMQRWHVKTVSVPSHKKTNVTFICLLVHVSVNICKHLICGGRSLSYWVTCKQMRHFRKVSNNGSKPRWSNLSA